MATPRLTMLPPWRRLRETMREVLQREVSVATAVVRASAPRVLTFLLHGHSCVPGTAMFCTAATTRMRTRTRAR
jgi:hypothetical protein